MVNIEKIKTDIRNFYWTKENSEKEVMVRKMNYEQVFQSKNSDESIEVFGNLLDKLSSLFTCEVVNSTVAYFPSYSFRVRLNVEKHADYTIISEYHFYISILTMVYTGFYMKAVIDKIEIDSKMRNIMFNPLIITSSIKPYRNEFELTCNEIITQYPKYEFISLEDCFVRMAAENVTYTVNELNLFHLLFADIKKESFKIITTRHNKA